MSAGTPGSQPVSALIASTLTSPARHVRRRERLAPGEIADLHRRARLPTARAGVGTAPSTKSSSRKLNRPVESDEQGVAAVEVGDESLVGPASEQVASDHRRVEFADVEIDEGRVGVGADLGIEAPRVRAGERGSAAALLTR